MLAYIIRRLLLFIPTLFAIMVINFAVIQAAPGGPIEQLISQLKGTAVGATARFGGGAGGDVGGGAASANANQSRASRGLDPRILAQLKAQYGFDKPPVQRFLLMMRDYLSFDFGRSYTHDRPVVQLIKEKLPVSISLGLWSTLITYLVSIPLGIRKAVRDGSTFDVATSTVIFIGYSIPSFLFAVLLIVLFAGGTYWSWFPLRGLTSDNWLSLDWPHRILDYLWHITLPTTAMVIGNFAGITMLTKNSFLEEIHKQYVVTARAKGLTERRVLYGHVFRNAMLLVIAGFPSAFLGILFANAFLIESIFSLDGLGLLGYEAAINRDYPIMFATLYVFTLVGMVMKLVTDLTYTVVDPRIDFGTRGG